jgi:hypothetical protein
MQDFIDLQGASGATYRFRLWREGASHLPIAGNYVFVREDQKKPVVVLAGTSLDLSTCRADAGKATARGATHLYTRLNVARALRTAEHQDLVAHHKPELVSKPEA